MATLNLILLIFLCFFGLPSYTKPADVVVTTVGNQNMVEVSKANWAIIFVFFSDLPRFVGVFGGIYIDTLNILFSIVGIYSNSVTVF